MNQEKQRLKQATDGKVPWKNGDHISPKRQWETVREDYSPHGIAWEYISHDAARSRVYR